MAKRGNRPTTPSALRADIPAPQEDVYLNFGASGPSPRSVVEAAEDFLRRHEYEIGSQSDPYEMAFDAFDRTRERVADFVGAEPDEIALT
jgi:selenocysteine lyase/cysteine desulfurase